MATDIVERLREYARNCNEADHITVEAADEIKRLRAALQDIAIGVGESVLSQDAMRARAYDALQVI